MFRTRSTWALLLAAGLACMAGGVAAQPAPSPAAPASLREFFDAAWERQPESRAAAARRDAAAAGKAASQRLTPEPMALELQSKTGRGAEASREYEATVAIPLWLPGERTRSVGLADAQLGAVDLRTRAAQLRLAGSVREAWWSAQRAEVDVAAARERVAGAQQLATDVSRRVQAGDLARSDLHQAESALAQARSALAEAEGQRLAARGALRAFAAAPVGLPSSQPEPVPAGSAAADSHPAVAEARSRALVARRAQELSAVQRRANPELTVGAVRERGTSEGSTQSLVVGMRIPFGGGPLNTARVATAQAEALEAEATADLELSRVETEAESSRARLAVAEAQVQAAERRASLALETRSFFDKSFRLGESDLPTRLRVEQEAAEAQRALARSRLDAAAAISQLRQALGLFFE